jgi:hypothetical protein
MTSEHTDTLAAVAAKSAPPITVSLATFMGVQVSELVLWATLIYTLLLIMRTLYRFYRDLFPIPSAVENVCD